MNGFSTNEEKPIKRCFTKRGVSLSHAARDREGNRREKIRIFAASFEPSVCLCFFFFFSFFFLLPLFSDSLTSLSRSFFFPLRGALQAINGAGGPRKISGIVCPNRRYTCEIAIRNSCWNIIFHSEFSILLSFSIVSLCCFV